MTVALIAYRHNREMLRAALWGVRTISLGVVGLLTFLAPPSARGVIPTQCGRWRSIRGGGCC
jgi:hypothetical protein